LPNELFGEATALPRRGTGARQNHFFPEAIYEHERKYNNVFGCDFQKVQQN
jgi:hypothetical protein